MNSLDSGKGSVELSLLDVLCVCGVAVDGLQGRGSVETEHVGCDANDGSVFLVGVVKLEIAVSLPGTPCCVPVKMKQSESVIIRGYCNK